MTEIDTSTEAARLMAVKVRRASPSTLFVYSDEIADFVAAIAADRDRLAANLAEAEQARSAAIVSMSEAYRLHGEAEGKLAASEMAGVVEGWRDRAEKAERGLAAYQGRLFPTTVERDQARADLADAKTIQDALETSLAGEADRHNATASKLATARAALVQLYNTSDDRAWMKNLARKAYEDTAI